jgi:hypothetical protein
MAWSARWEGWRGGSDGYETLRLASAEFVRRPRDRAPPVLGRRHDAGEVTTRAWTADLRLPGLASRAPDRARGLASVGPCGEQCLSGAYDFDTGSTRAIHPVGSGSGPRIGSASAASATTTARAARRRTTKFPARASRRSSSPQRQRRSLAVRIGRLDAPHTQNLQMSSSKGLADVEKMYEMPRKMRFSLVIYYILPSLPIATVTAGLRTHDTSTTSRTFETGRDHISLACACDRCGSLQRWG